MMGMSGSFSLLKVGCCGFCMAQKSYFGQFRLLEVQHTFYQPPRIETLRRWRDKAPPDFEFVVKAWQLITHPASSPTYRRLRHPLPEDERTQAGFFRSSDVVMGAWETTAACASALEAERILFQCPPSFQPSSENVSNLLGFFTTIDREGRTFLWEPRGAWPAELVRSLCDDLDLIHVVDPFRQDTVTPETVYYRMHGPRGRYNYTDQELASLLDLLPEDAPAHVLFNNVAMRDDVLRLLEQIEAS